MNSLEKTSDFLFYNDETGEISVQIIAENETVWTTQKGMAQLFRVGVSAISKHIKKIFEEGELQENTTVSKMETVVNRGFRGEVKEEIIFYNLDVIIAVGYRVNSYQATKFRIWATGVLKEYLIKGFVLDDERLKQGNNLFNKDYFQELLKRIREIRASEMMFYEKVKNLYSYSIDYDPNSPETHNFYALVQNKLLFAITGKTAAEIIYNRIDTKDENLGLTNWKEGKKGGNIHKSDVTVSKHYLTEEELTKLNKLVNSFLDRAERLIELSTIMKMADWRNELDKYLDFNSYEVLIGLGKISKAKADNYAEKQYLIYKENNTQKKIEVEEMVQKLSSTNDFPK